MDIRVGDIVVCMPSPNLSADINRAIGEVKRVFPDAVLPYASVYFDQLFLYPTLAIPLIDLEVIDHIDETPEIRRGDVVVIHTGVGLENRYGWIGVADYTLPKVGVLISKETQGYIAEYPAEVLEVIDHDESLLEEPKP
jgi:hypothetical protein